MYVCPRRIRCRPARWRPSARQRSPRACRHRLDPIARRPSLQLPSWGRCPCTSRQRSRASTDVLRPPQSLGAAVFTLVREASDRAHAPPAHVIEHRPRMSTQCASVRESLRHTPGAGPPRQRLDRRVRRSVRHAAERRYVGRAPTACGHDHRQAGRDRLIPALPRAARTSPRARQPPNQRRPGVPLASPHGANRNAQRETGPARPLPPQHQAQTHGHPGASVRRPHPGHLAPHWRAAALTASACVVDRRSLHRTRPEGLARYDQQTITASAPSHGYATAWHQGRHGHAESVGANAG